MTPSRLRVTEKVARSGTWGDRPPIDDGEARNRLLDAAEVCYERHGVSRTTVDDIAREASVHRTTVYRYFGSRDDVLAFVILRESAGVIEGAQQTMEGSRLFSKRLLDALDGAIAAVEKSRWLRVLFSPESFTMTVAAEASMTPAWTGGRPCVTSSSRASSVPPPPTPRPCAHERRARKGS
jgi:AcrR family transcriptional regulator